MENSQQFSLRWNNYLHHISGAFHSLRASEDFVDVTLSCEGKKIKAHKMLLSACSNYFREIFKENECRHPVIVFHNIKYEDLFCLVTFMYQGQVNVDQECLQSFLNTAELLEVQGLTTGTTGGPSSTSNSHKHKRHMDEEFESGSEGGSSGQGQDKASPRSPSPPVVSPGQTPSKRRLKRPPPPPDQNDVPHDSTPELPHDDEPSGKFVPPHSENSLTQDYDEAPPYYPNMKAEDQDISSITSALDPTSGSSNDFQDSLQVFAHGLWRRLDPSLKRFNCDECGKVFKHPRSLDHHKKMHEGRTTCPVCRRVFGRMYALRLHISASHPHVDLRKVD